MVANDIAEYYDRFTDLRRRLYAERLGIAPPDLVHQATDHVDHLAGTELGEYAASAKEEWAKLVRRYRVEDARTEPMVTLVANDNWVELTLRYVVDCKARRKTKDRLFTRLLEEIAKTDGAVQLASATFEVTAAPRLELRGRIEGLGASGGGRE